MNVVELTIEIFQGVLIVGVGLTFLTGITTILSGLCECHATKSFSHDKVINLQQSERCSNS